uniref:Uncharacterized protein n=1 Tax=Tanacetum cinerariifolium TaxID=118510 RepID=A0A699HKY7_TANCI|nr:hypothetical protein [Tanacetum cinerariifolium]
MLDSYTFDMRIQSWGRSSYARALIEIQADTKLKDTIVVAMLKLVRRGSIRVLFVLSMSGNLLGVRVVSSTSTTPIVGKILKIERLIINEKVTLVDDEEKVGYGTNGLLDHRNKTYKNADNDYDPYNDDMYEGQKIPNKIQSICDNLDIKVRGKPILPTLEVKVEEKMLKVKVVKKHVEKIQNLQIGYWWEYGRRVKKYEGYRVDVKYKSTKDKVRRERVFGVDEAIDSENLSASSFHVRGNDG